jgi:membrane dipeptidase
MDTKRQGGPDCRRPQNAWPRSSAERENEVDRLDILYGLGIRSSGIAYSEANTLGCGLRQQNDGGLTEFGRAAVQRMNKLGIAIDVSHSGDQTSLDMIAVSSKPIFMTHAGARACGRPGA